jgi:gliding motility-associated-like protein
MIVAHPGDFAGITADTSVCPNDSVQLMATGGVGYKWSPAMYLDNPNAARPWAKPITTQIYSVIATNSDGCRDTLSMLLKVHPAAVVHLEDSVTIFSGESYQINPQTNGTKFSWTPSGGLSGKYIANPLATPEVSTKYILMATTEEGCIAKDSITITLNDNALVEVPNAFTPGSGANNKIFPMRRGLVSLKSFRIFNRWGNLVYESADIDAGWDGTYKGAAQPIGVYVYTIEAVTDKGKLITKSGNITLLR